MVHSIRRFVIQRQSGLVRGLRDLPLATCLCLGLVLAGLTTLPAHARDEVVLRWSAQGDSLTYDPHAQNETPTISALSQIYEPLVQRGLDMSIVPALATSWTLLDPLIWEFKLREGVQFQDGTPLTAEDVVFSIKRAKTETSDYATYLEPVVEAIAVDTHTVQLITGAPYPLLLENLTTIFIMSRDWAAKHDVVQVQDRAAGEENYAVRNANGTGAFKLDIREPDIRTVLVRHDNWWGLDPAQAVGPAHNLDRIIFRPIANNATRVAALLSGELDFLLDPPVADLARIERTPGLSLSSTPQTRTIFFGMEMNRDELRASDVKGANPFKDKRVREALYRAINVDAIKRVIMRGRAAPAGQIVAPGINGYTEEFDTRLEHDPAKAKALLAEAGYEDGFRVKLDCPNDRYINDEAICQAVVSMLARIGVKVDLDAQPKSLHFPKIENRTTDFYLLGWGVPTLDSEYVFSYLYRTGGTWNAGSYSNPALDEIIDAMSQETDREARNKLIASAWEIAIDEIVYLPLHHQVITWAGRETVDIPIMVDDIPRLFWARIE